MSVKKEEMSVRRFILFIQSVVCIVLCIALFFRSNRIERLERNISDLLDEIRFKDSYIKHIDGMNESALKMMEEQSDFFSSYSDLSYDTLCFFYKISGNVYYREKFRLDYIEKKKVKSIYSIDTVFGDCLFSEEIYEGEVPVSINGCTWMWKDYKDL